MKILIVHNHYQNRGGEDAVVNAQVNLLRQRGDEVLLYTRDSAEITDIAPIKQALRAPQVVFSRDTYREIQSLVSRERPDVAHIHNVFPLISPSVYRALHDAAVPIVQTIHNFRLLCPNGLFFTHDLVCERCKSGNTLHAVRLRCFRDSYQASALYAASIGLHRQIGTFNLIDRFIALNRFAANRLVESGLTTQDRIRVIGNFIPDPLPQSRRQDNHSQYVVYLGRLAPEKGVDTLIRAMARTPQITLRILGSGPLETKLRNLVQELGLRNVEFLGYIDGEEKWHQLRGALAIVLPSVWYEQFPVSVLESLAVGTPVLASRIGSLPTLVDDTRNGLLFTPGDAIDLSTKLIWIADHPEIAAVMGQHARSVVESNYTASIHYQQLMHAYEEVTSLELLPAD